MAEGGQTQAESRPMIHAPLDTISGYNAIRCITGDPELRMSLPANLDFQNIDIGYARVSTDDQDCSLQIEALVKSGVHPDYIFTDMSSGRSFKREGLLTALKMCIPRGQVEKFPEGSILKFCKLDRLGRDLVEIIITANRLDQRGVRFMSLTEPQSARKPGRRRPGALSLT